MNATYASPLNAWHLKVKKCRIKMLLVIMEKRERARGEREQGGRSGSYLGGKKYISKLVRRNEHPPGKGRKDQ